MKTKLLGCLAAMATTMVVATPAIAFRGGGGHMTSMGGGHFGPMFAGRSVALGSFNRAGRFARDDRFHHFHHFRRFRNFAFFGFGAPFAYDYAAYGNGCWRQAWTPYGWQWSNICYDYGDSYGY
jgi:hypothetical protein